MTKFRFPQCDVELSIMVTYKQRRHIADHVTNPRERWGLVLDPELLRNLRANRFADWAAEDGARLDESIVAEIEAAVSFPRLVVYTDTGTEDSTDTRQIRLLISDRCLVVVVRLIPERKHAKVLTAYIPTEVRRLKDPQRSDGPNVIDMHSLNEVLWLYLSKYVPMQGDTLPTGGRFVYEEPFYDRKRGKTTRRMTGLHEPVTWGFDSNKPGTHFVGLSSVDRAVCDGKESEE